MKEKLEKIDVLKFYDEVSKIVNVEVEICPLRGLRSEFEVFYITLYKVQQIRKDIQRSLCPQSINNNNVTNAFRPYVRTITDRLARFK